MEDGSSYICDCDTNKPLTGRELLEALNCEEHDELLREFIALVKDIVPKGNTPIDTPVWCKQHLSEPWGRRHICLT